ncbi:hypothetical protein HDU81_008840 [Chytriomyces hyalinus]|nr:hypothetical protein HDU81_008840 [Chytriomyces hyalinus]
MKRESLVSTCRIPRSNAIANMHESFGVPNSILSFTNGDGDALSSASNSEAFQLEEARQHNVASAQGRGTNISDINKRWNEMMKSPASNADSVVAEKAKSANVSVERVRADASAGSFGPQSKKKISFSEKVMYRSISHLALEDPKDILDRQINAVVSDIWTDDENEDDTLYSDEGSDWPKKDEFEAIVDGLNIMSLPMDDEDDLPPRQTRMPGTSHTVPSAPPVTLNRISFSTSPIHKFIQPQNHVNDVPANPLFVQQKPSSNAATSRDHAGFNSTASDNQLKPILTRSFNLKAKSEIDPEQKPAASASNFQSPTANPIYTTEFAHAIRSEMLLAKETGISPILMRSGNSQAPTRSIFNDIDSSDIRWDKCFEAGETPAPSSSPWIKRASQASPEDYGTAKPAYSASLTTVTLNLPLLHEAESSPVKPQMDEGSLESLAGSSESQTADQPILATNLPVKSNLSSDSLNLEEEEIVLESIRPGTGEKVSSAFFISVDKAKPTEDSGNFKGSKPISHAAPILVNVAPQSLPSQALTPRSTVSDAWIKNPDSADSPRAMLSAASKRKTKKAPPYLKSDSKSSKEQRLAVEEEFEVPIVVVKMNVPLDKSKLKDNADDLLQNTNRDSSATLVNVERERVVSQKTLKTSNFIPLDHERTAKNQVPPNEGMDPESSPSPSVGRINSLSPYQSTKANIEHESEYIHAQNTAQYRQQFREHYLSIHRDKSKLPYSSPRRSNHPSSYRQYSLNSPSYNAMNYDQPYKSQSAMLMNPEIQKRWTAANSARTLVDDSKMKHSKPFYADSAHLGKTQSSSSVPKSPTNATTPTLLRSSTTRLHRPFRSFITAPPNSVNSSRATTPLTPSNGSMSSLCGVSMSNTGVLVGTPRKHYRRISFASTTSSLRSVRNRGGGGSGILVEESGMKGFQSGTRSVSSFESNHGLDGLGDILADKRMECSGPVQVEDMNENAEADGVEILEGKRSFPSLPRINSHQEVGVGLRRRKRNQSVIKKWFQDLWCKVVGVFKTRRR